MSGLFWLFIENICVNNWYFGDRLSGARLFFLVILAYTIFYCLGLFIFRKGINTSAIKQKMVIYGLAYFYVSIGILVLFTAKKEMLDTYVYIDDLQGFKDKRISNYTAIYQDLNFSKKSIFADETSRTIQLKNALMNAKAYHVNHDQWLLEGTLTIQFEDGAPLAFDWYVPKRESEIVVLQPNSFISIVIDKSWLDDKKS